MINRIPALVKFLIVFLLFSACSEDDSAITNPPESQLLIKNISTTTYNNGSVISVQSLIFEYENNVLTKVANDDFETRFFYNGEQLVRAESYFDNVLSQTNNFTYSGENLTQATNDNINSGVVNYTYSGSVLITKQFGFMKNDLFNSLTSTFYTFDNTGNLTEKLTATSSIVDNSTREVFTYDSKNNPAKYMNRYVRFLYEDVGLGFEGLTINNKMSAQIFQPSASETAENYQYEIEYNSADFPIKIQQFKSDTNELQFVTNIEYQ